jgi:hypothetical protein
MAFDQEQRAALRILEGIEDGTMSAADSQELVEAAEPVLVYLIFTWLRKRYADHTNADAVLGRLAAVSNRGTVPAQMKEGKQDSLVEWFEETYSYKDLDAKQFIEIVIDKLES